MIANHRVLHQRTHPFWQKIPLNYLNCLNKECPLSEKMSASHSARYSEENNMTFRVLNHRMLDTDNCKYYIEILLSGKTPKS